MRDLFDRAIEIGLGITVAVSILVMGALLSSCGKEASQVLPTGNVAKACTVVQESTGAIIFCPDGSSAFVSNGTSTHCDCNKKDCNK